MNAELGIDVTVFGMMTVAWQRNVNAVGLIEGKNEGVMVGEDGAEVLGAILGWTDGLPDGEKDGTTDGLTVGAILDSTDGESERGSELHVDKPEPAHAGYTQAGVEANGVVPNVIPAQFSMTAVESLVQ